MQLRLPHLLPRLSLPTSFAADRANGDAFMLAGPVPARYGSALHATGLSWPERILAALPGDYLHSWPNRHVARRFASTSRGLRIISPCAKLRRFCNSVSQTLAIHRKHELVGVALKIRDHRP